MNIFWRFLCSPTHLFSHNPFPTTCRTFHKPSHSRWTYQALTTWRSLMTTILNFYLQWIFLTAPCLISWNRKETILRIIDQESIFRNEVIVIRALSPQENIINMKTIKCKKLQYFSWKSFESAWMQVSISWLIYNHLSNLSLDH